MLVDDRTHFVSRIPFLNKIVFKPIIQLKVAYSFVPSCCNITNVFLNLKQLFIRHSTQCCNSNVLRLKKIPVGGLQSIVPGIGSGYILGSQLTYIRVVELGWHLLYSGWKRIYSGCRSTLHWLSIYPALPVNLPCSGCRFTLHWLSNYPALGVDLSCTGCRFTLHWLSIYPALVVELPCTGCRITLHWLSIYPALAVDLPCTGCRITLH